MGTTDSNGGEVPGTINHYCFDYVADASSDRPDKGLGASGDCCYGNPINPASGNKFQTEVDLPQAYEGGLYFHRTYNSLLEGEQRFNGAHWTHSWDRRIEILDQGVKAIRPDGTRVLFSPGANGVLTGDGDAKITLDNLGGSLRLTTETGEIELYDGSGKLLSVTDAKGHTTTLTYTDGTKDPPNGGRLEDDDYPIFKGLLLRVTDYLGRRLGFKYIGRGRISTIVGPAGEQFKYEYGPENPPPPEIADTAYGARLRMVTYPDGKTRSYFYNEPQFTSGSLALFFALTGSGDNGVRNANYEYSSDGKKAIATEAFTTDPVTGTVTVNRHAFTYGDHTVSHQPPIGTCETLNFVSVLGRSRLFQRTVRSAASPSNCPGSGSTFTETLVRDANGNVTSRTDFNGNLTCYTYDSSRNLETSRIEGRTGTCAAPVTTPATRTITTEWRASSRHRARIAEPLLITTYRYHGDAGVSCAPAGAPTTLVCAREMQATTDVDGTQAFLGTPSGSPRITTHTYNALGQVLTVSGPRPENATTYSYYAANDPAGNYSAGDLFKVTDGLGHETTFTEYFGEGRPRKIVDPNGLVTTLDYWPRGWLKSRNVGGEITSYEYTATGQVLKVTGPDGSLIEYTYDDANRLTDVRDGLGNHIAYTLDAAGNRTLEQSYDTDVPVALVRQQQREIDALNRISKLIGGTNPSQQVTQYGYDGNGNVVSILDPLLREGTQFYDARDRLTEIRDPVNGTAAPTRYEYNGRDVVTKVTDPKGLATLYTVNGFGETLTLDSPDTGVTTYTYDAASNLRTKIDARGMLATYSYDALDRLTGIAYPDETVTFTYDSCTNGIGRLCSVADKTGTTSYAYDIHGRVTAKSQTVGSVAQVVQYAYNASGQLSGLTTPAGRALTYGYTNNRITSIAMNGQTVLDGVAYEPFGPNGGWRWGNSTTSAINTHTRVYDRDFRPTRITSDLPASGAQPVLDRQLSWDIQSRVSGITDLGNTTLSTTYGYDGLDRLTSATQGPNSWGFTYDGVGNRLTSTVGGASTTYAYPGTSHRLSGLSGAQVKAYSYDGAGNRTSDGSTTWTYGGNSRPTQAGATPILINALGQRVKKGTGASAVRFVYDERGHLIGEYDEAGTPIRETVWLDDLPVAVIQ
jgi:YD repeat-containing protein